jgi:hypothetical protein
MPREGRNTHHISHYKNGYVLKSGKTLSQEDAELIGKEAGLDTTRVGDDNVEYLKPEWKSSEYAGAWLTHNNPVYRPYIDENPPTPPMLQFLSSSTFDLEGLPTKSAYTINLNTLKPTKNSPIQKGIPECILSKYRR